MKKYKKLPKYALGVSQLNNINNSVQGFANYGDSISTGLNGSQNQWAAAGTGALKGAGTGATLGMAFGPIGSAIGAGAGLLGGAVMSYFGAKKRNKEIAQTEEEQARMEAEAKAERDKQEAELKGQQQLNYSRSYYAAMPSYGQMGSSVYAYGTKKLPSTNTYAMGGNFTPISSNVAKVNGDSHSQDTNKDGQNGVVLQESGNPIAEVEGGETIINNQSVASNRLALPNGNTIAAESYKIAKEISKNEKNLDKGTQTNKNTSKRNIEKLNLKLAKILDYQEDLKSSMNIEDGKMMAYGGNLNKYPDGVKNFRNPYYSPAPYWESKNKEILNNEDMLQIEDTSGHENINKLNTKTIEETPQTESYKYNNLNGFAKNLNSAATAVAPYIDNISNLKLIGKTPQVATPLMDKAYLQTAMPMKTTYNINPQLDSATKSYKDYIKNLDDNTSNSAISRGNKLGAFAKTLENKSSLYGQKENIETQLTNADTQNRQQVSNANATNYQNVENRNLAKLDAYNSKKEARLDDNRRELSKNVANLSTDLKTGIYNKDVQRVEHEKIMYDALSKRDGAAISELIGSDYMDNYVTDPKSYKLIENNLKDQPMYLKKFYEKYGKRS